MGPDAQKRDAIYLPSHRELWGDWFITHVHPALYGASGLATCDVLFRGMSSSGKNRPLCLPGSFHLVDMEEPHKQGSAGEALFPLTRSLSFVLPLFSHHTW